MKSKNKDETSDTDSGIIIQSGPDSPMAAMKDLTQAMRKQQKALEERLEACLQELRRLCLREAELTGMLSSEYPLKPGEKPPKVRRRIGAAFKLDQKAILLGADPLSTLERDLALQLQIAEAARCLSKEENLAKQVRKRRKSAVLKEEKKLKELEQALSDYRLASKQPSQLKTIAPALEGFSAPDERSLLDGTVRGEEVPVVNPHLPSKITSWIQIQSHHSPSSQLSPLGFLEDSTHYPAAEVESSPIQNSPWKETSLDKPYEKPKKSMGSNSTLSTASIMPPPAPSPSIHRAVETHLCHLDPPRKLEVRRQAGSSAPPTPEFLGRRGPSQLIRVCSTRESLESRGRSALPRRRPTYYTVTVPEFCFSASNPNPAPKANFHSASEDSSSDVSSISYTTSAGSSSPDISFMKPASIVSKEEPTQLFHSQVCKGQEAEYHRLCPQNLRSGSGFFPATEHVPGSHLTAGRELCHGRPSFLSSNSAHFAYKEETVPVKFHRSVVSHSRVVRTPSLKDFVPVGPRVLSKAAVTEELKSWHERTRLRNARPHSLDRQGAFRVRSIPGRELHSPCSLGHTIQVPRVHILKRSPEGAPVQVYVPENGEIITQV
ncbi:innate immunity activator protein isoform X1 [Ahaetulla prasina]|uniref:innate immunity activator protein isoform X1 n=1 Tax=Ahaetulla prasina TaxID=499056 RepID=UPI002647A455|nr:innate immunity activator protein isoform X1 [Ahaetulla prasina]XP_058035206.1 innate immunity activator protein isoform X1 [Ahaetulla prasina]XP_058035207.1 innate immunity activator protein isoform X1 [Ahaetulla prasina]XP_058035208.1 innate immunity activator protein isoform X1 [Ahaetulla prasina]